MSPHYWRPGGPAIPPDFSPFSMASSWVEAQEAAIEEAAQHARNQGDEAYAAEAEDALQVLNRTKIVIRQWARSKGWEWGEDMRKGPLALEREHRKFVRSKRRLREMKIEDISDEHCKEAARRFHTGGGLTPNTLDQLVEITGAPWNVCLQKLQSLCNRGLMNYGVSVVTAWWEGVDYSRE